MKSTTFRTMLLCAAVPIAFIAEPVLAQDQPETEASEPAQEEITVTGSLIARSDATAFAPVSVFSAADIVDSGSLSVSEVLRSDPAIGAGSRGPTNTINGNGIQTLDLRSLGNRRTLVLLNGRRFPIYADSLNNAGQDVSAIPTGLIKRIDVLRDGASTTYGADAVAGVVNFILADKFDGVELSGLSGITGAGDGATYRLAGKVGIASDRGSLVVSGQYQKQESIPLYSRSWARDGVQLIGATSVIRNQSITPGGRVVSAAGATLACYPEAGGASVAPACPTFDAARQLDLTVGSTNYSFGAAGQYEVTDAIKLDIQGFYNSRESAFGIPATNINTSGSTGPFPNILIPATSSNNRFGQPIAVRVNLFDYGARINRGDADTVWLSGGLSGTVFGRFNWQVAQTYGQTKALNEVTNQVNTLNLQRLLIPSACVADSICAPIGAIPDIAAFLSHQTPLSAAQRNYLFYTETTRGKFVSAQTLATISGPLFELPGGSASIAVGLEHRVEQGETSVDAVTRSGAAATLIQPGGGKFKTNEIFGEINLPLLAGLPFASELTVNLQARYSDFSNFGGADTYKAGVNYAPIEDIRFRAVYGTSFRAPDVVELYSGGVGANSTLLDPCNATGLRASNATVASNCAALGVPANYAQPLSIIPTLGGGNPSLQPERGRSITAGVVVTPRFLPGFSITADYYDVRITNAISNGLLQPNLNACYAASNFAARASDVNDVCFSFATRGTDGSLVRILNRSSNLSSFNTTGVDFTVRYASPAIAGLGNAALDATIRGSYLEKYEQNGVDFAGAFIGGVLGNSVYPKWRGTGEFGVTAGQFRVQWTVDFVDAMRDTNVGAAIPASNALNYQGVGEYFSHSLLFKVSDVAGANFSFGVNNVFDRDPPFAYNPFRNALSVFHDQIGRYFFVAVSKKF